MPIDLRYLLLSILVLAAGPLLQHLARRVPHLLKTVNLFVSVAAGLLVLLHILPDVVAEGGLLAAACAAAGLAVPTLVERKLHRLATRAHAAALILAVGGIMVHGVIDGMAIAAPGSSDSPAVLPLAVLLHRIPAGMAVWFLVSSSHGNRFAVVALSGVGIATSLGFLVVDLPFGEASGPVVNSFRALVAGSLLHVLLHRTGGHEHHHRQ